MTIKDSRRNIIEDLHDFQIDSKTHSNFRRKQIYSQHAINQLTKSSELIGHEGCVNCLEWSRDGTRLASGSDDLSLIIWDPFKRKPLRQIHTRHTGNIFSVKFMPLHNDNLTISSAADRLICIYDINSKRCLNELGVHKNRVKRLTVSHDNAYLFWSSGEDGYILQHDIRCSPNEMSSIFINYKRCHTLSNQSINENLETKCLAINPIRTEQIAVGCNDPFVRVYDRRMIDTQLLNQQSPENVRCVHENLDDVYKKKLTKAIQYFIPGHLPSRINEYRRKMKHLGVTYLTFNENGSELLVNLSSEQIYLFNVNETHGDFSYVKAKELFMNLPDEVSTSKKVKLSRRVEDLKVQANDHYESGFYTKAIECYNEAIRLCSHSSILFGNRAAALMKRSWDSDYYEAMRDCVKSLELEPHHTKSHFRLAKCLYELKFYNDAQECLNVFTQKYPDYTTSKSYQILVQDLKKALKKKEKHDEEKNLSELSENDVCAKGERELELNSIDYSRRFLGHCNVATDIKEAEFIGEDFIGAGSDDGYFFMWNRHTSNIEKIFKADDSIVNCVQPNLTTSLIATSGIDSTIKLWEPLLKSDDTRNSPELVKTIYETMSHNQQQMNAHPLEFFFAGMASSNDGVDEYDDRAERVMSCNTS